MRATAVSIPVALFAALVVFAPGQFTMAQTSTKQSTSTATAKKSTKSSTPKSTAAKTTAAKSTMTRTAAKSTAAKSSLAKSTSAGRTPSKSGAKQSASSYHPAQQQPTQDRYKEIQQALADKGYFGGPVDGNWGPASMDALKRFQHDQSLIEDGKVGSLSLIALGLGPKRGTTATHPAPAQPPVQSQQAEPPQ